MKKLTLFFISLALPLLIFSQQPPYSRVKIFLEDHTVSDVLRTGIEATHLNLKEGWMIAELSPDELQKVSGAGFKYAVLVEDLQHYYRQRNINASGNIENLKSGTALSQQWPVPANFTLGTCGGFLTVDDMLAQLDLMRSLYPNLITYKQSISDTITTIEGRQVYFVKISDNPDLPETEPQVLYTGMHHAREPIGMQHLMYYMWYLLENYNSDPDIKNVVDNTEMYFVPVFNVDGYTYNITTNPYGGGMWRKNRRNSGGGNFGIDINRNYGYMWGYDDEGSSPDPSSDLYRGTAPFSEPETRMMREFCTEHQFRIALNYHSYSNLFLYAWGWSSFPTPDENLFSTYAAAMTKENNYTYGAGNTTIYPTNGGSDDWMYGEQISKPKILAYTPEVGNSLDGFWPTEERILPLCQENMLASLTAARLVGHYGKIKDKSSLFLYQNQGYLNLEVQRLGLQEGSFTASIVPLGTSFTSVGAPVVMNDMGLLEKRNDSIIYQLSNSNHVGDTIRYILVLDNGMYTIQDTVERIYGYPYPVFTDRLDNKNNWTGSWSVTTSEYYSPPSSITDSPSGNYGSNNNRSITLINALSLSPTLLTVLEFRAKWKLEAGYDYVQVKISANNGVSWTPLAGNYTRPGTLNQAYNQPLYDGIQDDWIREAISLNPWQDNNVKLQFNLRSDAGTEFDGYYFDDVQISVLLDPTFLEEKTQSQTWLSTINPNPVSQKCRINYIVPGQTRDARLRVLTLTGQEKFSSRIIQSEGWMDLDVEGWPAGVYLVSLETGVTPRHIRKLVVN